jgi:hypothetical protein
MAAADPSTEELLRSHLHVPDHVAFREFPNETVVLNLKTGRYHSLNPVAGDMLKTLEDVGDIEQAAQRLAERYEASPSEIRADLTELVSKMVQRELLEARRKP